MGEKLTIDSTLKCDVLVIGAGGAVGSVQIRCSGASDYDPTQAQNADFAQRGSPMANTLPDFKHKALERCKAGLLEEYEAVSRQLESALEAGQHARLQHKLESMEDQIKLLRGY